MNDGNAQGVIPPVPQFRMWICGTFLLKRSDGTPVPMKAWGGSQDARRLLKALWCKGRSVGRCELIEILWPQRDPEEAGPMLSDAAYQLRKVLKPDPDADGSLLMSIDKGSSFRLGGQELLWVDSDEALDQLEEAEVARASGLDPLFLVEQAASYLLRGTIEETAEWANGKRRTVTDARHGCLLWQADLYAERGLLRKGERVLRMLWEEDPTDEDTLGRLMLNLQQQHRTFEALRLYEGLIALLRRESDEPLEETRALANRLHRESQSSMQSSNPHVRGALHASPEPRHAETGILMSSMDALDTRSSWLGLTDPATWIEEKLAHLLMIIEHCGAPTRCSQLQEHIGRELDTMPPNSNESYTLSRRQLLVTLATLPTSLLLAMLQGRLSAGGTEQLLSRCAVSLTACWNLMRGCEYPLVDELLSPYVPLLAAVAQDSTSKHRTSAASLTTQAYRLKGILALHRNASKERDSYFQRAVYYAEAAENPGLLVAALISLAYHKGLPSDAEQLYQQALLHVKGISPLQRSRLYAEVSVAYAQENRPAEAMHYLRQAQTAYPASPENDPSFLYAEFSPASMVLENGRVHLALTQHRPEGEHPHLAWETFARVQEGQTRLVLSERIKYEIINYQAETALALGDRDLCCEYIERGVSGAQLLGSEKRRKEIFATRSKALKTWRHDPRVQSLKTLLA